MVATEQITIDRETPLTRAGIGGAGCARARAALRTSVPHASRCGRRSRGWRASSRGSSPAASRMSTPRRSGLPRYAGPRLLSLAELERERDRLVVCLREAQQQARERAELELRARDQLERMRLEPGRYKFVRLRVDRPRRTWLRRVGGASPPRPDRDARRLVAAEALLGLSVTVAARPRRAADRRTTEHLISAAACPAGSAGSETPRGRSAHRLSAGRRPARDTPWRACVFGGR